MSSSAFARDYLVLDACCIINLCASDHMDEILAAIPTRIAIAEYVNEKGENNNTGWRIVPPASVSQPGIWALSLFKASGLRVGLKPQVLICPQ